MPTPPRATSAAACSATSTHKRKLDDSCIAEEDVAPAVDSVPGLSVPAKGGDHAASNDGAACLFSSLLDNAADVMRDDTPTGRAARERLADVLVRDSGQVAEDTLGRDYGLTMAFTSICRSVLAVGCHGSRWSDVLNFRPGQDSLLPSETYEGLVDAEDFKPNYLDLMKVDCLSIIWATLYHNVVCWSDRGSTSGVEDASGGVAAAQEAHWRAIQLLGALAARCKPPGLAGTKAAEIAVQALEWLNGVDNEGGEEAAMPCLLDTLRPAGKRAFEWCQLDPNSARSSFLDLHPMQAAVRTFLDRPAEPDFKTGMEVFHDLPLDEESRRIATKAASLQAGTLIEAATVMLDAMASGDAVVIKDAVATFKCLKGMVEPPGANEHRQALLTLAIIADELCDESLSPLEREKVLPPSLSAMDGEVLQVACPALAKLVRYPEGVKLAAAAIKAQSCHIFVRVRKQTLCKALGPEAIEELEGYIAMAPALVEDLGSPLDIWTALRAALASMSCYKLMKPKLNPVLDLTYNSWIIPEKVGDKPSMLAHPRNDETAARMELAAIEGSDEVIWGMWYARRQKWRQVPPDPLLLLLQLTLTAPLPLEQDAAARGLACVTTVKAILPAIYAMECIRGALKAMLPYCPPLMEPGSSEKPDASCLYALLLGRPAGCSMWTEALKAAEAAALPLLRRVDVLCSALYGGSRGSLSGGKVSSIEALVHKYGLPSTAQAVASLQGHGEIGRTLKAWGCGTKELEKDVENRQCCRGLIDLPGMYQDLYLHLVGKECSRCKKALARKEDSSALCLVCGALMCCARVACTTTYPGPCCRHAADCGAGVGVFLMLPSTKTLVLSHSRAAVLPSLYLDAQGEEDPNMSRGRPLHRDAARWERLQALHANMALDFDTVVLGEAQGGRALKGSQIY